ncbi:MAG: CotH kinase family protein [Faecalibacterium sp.]
MRNKKGWIFLFSLLLCAACVGYSFWQYEQSETQMPVIILDPYEDQKYNTLKELRPTTITVTYPNQMGTLELQAQVRLRGNSTLYFSKKSYKIELEEKLDLRVGVDIEESSDREWVLLANSFDHSNLRNYYAFWVAARLGNFGFVPEGIFVELYVTNDDGENEYCGVYLLCEQIEVQETRVDVDVTTETEKGFLIEMVEYPQEIYTIEVAHEGELIEYDVRSQVEGQEDLDRIEAVLQSVEDALATGEQSEIEAVLDMDSCVDMYILQEYIMNRDVGWASFYYYCEAGESVLYMGPPWDFDRSMGSSSTLYGGSYEGLSAGNAEVTDTYAHPWFQTLMQMEWFQELVKERWNETKDIYAAGLVEIQGLSEDYATQMQDNFDVWYTEKVGVDQMVVYGENYAEDAEYLFNWLENRYLWFDNYWNGADG